MQLSLTTHDKQFLFGKYIKDGLNRDEADFRVKKLVLHLRKIADAKQKAKSPEDMHKVFLEELEKFYY
ncbi:MAG: hypothetical protein KAQ92_03945 [Candidatus Aenigmarchaeota archaeon]|nr:hypothetical protein [Candidatus Aenigmarchaeota archaeon]